MSKVSHAVWTAVATGLGFLVFLATAPGITSALHLTPSALGVVGTAVTVLTTLGVRAANPFDTAFGAGSAPEPLVPPLSPAASK